MEIYANIDMNKCEEALECLSRINDYIPLNRKSDTSYVVNLINRKYLKGETLLIAAARQNHLPLIVKLIQLGADITICDDQYLTVLYYACKHNNLELLKIFLEDPVSKTLINLCNLGSLAISHNNNEMLDLLLKSGLIPSQNSNIMYSAVKAENIALIKLLVTMNVTFDNWNVYYNNNFTFNFDILKMLLENNCIKVNKSNSTDYYNLYIFTIKSVQVNGIDCPILMIKNIIMCDNYVIDMVSHIVRNIHRHRHNDLGTCYQMIAPQVFQMCCNNETLMKNEQFLEILSDEAVFDIMDKMNKIDISLKK